MQSSSEQYYNTRIYAPHRKKIDEILEANNLKKTYELPLSSFDRLQQEGIIINYVRLIQEFCSLEEKEQVDFLTEYAAFFNLVRSLDIKKIETHRRDAYLRNYAEPESLFNHILLQCRIFILRMYAKELLDDFQYRNAIAFGNFSEILDIRKLLSPVKLIATIINLPFLSIMTTIRYFMIKTCFIIPPKLYHQKSYNNLYEILIDITQLILFPACFLMTYRFLFGISIVCAILESIACPINQLIRPMLDFISSGNFFKLAVSIYFAAHFLPELLPLIFVSLIFFVLFRTAYNFLCNLSLSIEENKAIDIFPLPDRELDREIVDALSLVPTPATWSQRLFNTPKDAKCIIRDPEDKSNVNFTERSIHVCS